MTKFSARALTSCIPICRSDLFEEVTQSGSSQKVSRVWIVAGHVFVSAGNGSKLMTFDCKPVTHQHNIGSSTLDLAALSPAVMDVFISPASPDIAYIVQQNGHVHCWQFNSNYQWSAVCEFELCDDTGSVITSACLHPKRQAFYWCELQPGHKEEHRICSMALPDSGQKMSKCRQSCEVILQGCPDADLIPMDYGLLIVPRYKEGQIRVSIFWQPSVLQLVSVVTVVGNTARNHHDMRSPLVFSDVVLGILADLSKACPQTADLGAKQDMTTGMTVLLHLDGIVQSFHRVESDLKQSISVRTMKIPMPDSVLQTSHPSDIWSIHKNVIAITTSTNTIRLHSATEGHLIHELELDAGVSVRSLVCVRTPSVLLAVVTSFKVIVIQGGQRAVMENSVPNNKQYQTDALQLAVLVQKREENPGPEVLEELTALYTKWTSLQDQQPRSYLSDTVDGYLAEFWRLEEEASKLGHHAEQSCPIGAANDTKEMLKEAVARTRGMSPESAMAELLWLSLKYPHDLLAVLLGDLDVEKDTLTAGDLAQWTVTLGLEEGGGSHSPVTFELVCRLLYHEKPDALVAFVCNTQTVSEQSVGVSAFIRRKHKLQYYVRAMECLPEPAFSTDPHKAAIAKAQIILKGAAHLGAEMALRFLLRHRCWSEAIGLLQQLGTGFSQHSSLFCLLLQHLLQGQALSEYASDVFSLLPSWKSFLPALKVMSDNCDSQLLSSSPGLFCSGSPDIPLSAVQSALLFLLTSDPQKPHSNPPKKPYSNPKQ